MRSFTILLSPSGYVLRYRLHLATELIEVLSVRHGRRRPPKL